MHFNQLVSDRCTYDDRIRILIPRRLPIQRSVKKMPRVAEAATHWKAMPAACCMPAASQQDSSSTEQTSCLAATTGALQRMVCCALDILSDMETSSNMTIWYCFIFRFQIARKIGNFEFLQNCSNLDKPHKLGTCFLDNTFIPWELLPWKELINITKTWWQYVNVLACLTLSILSTEPVNGYVLYKICWTMFIDFAICGSMGNYSLEIDQK